MTKGPDSILRIPDSGNLVRISTLLSGNTFGARWWTDGKMEAPMLPDSPLLRKDPKTLETFWTDECEEVAEVELGSLEKSIYADVALAVTATGADIAQRLQEGETLTQKHEIYLRVRLWWYWNDPFRHGQSPPEEPTKACSENLLRLRALLDSNEPPARLMAAEVSRQLGDHEKAASLLMLPYPEPLEPSADVIRQANQREERGVLEIMV